MALTFGLVVAANNLLALKSFTTFLSNYRLFDKPSFISKWLTEKAQGWIDGRAMKEFRELREEVAKIKLNLTLNDCETGMFTVLHLATMVNERGLRIDKAKDLYSLIAHTQLEMEKLKKPKSDESYK